MDSQTYYRLIAAVSVLVVLLTLVIPICGKLAAKAGERAVEITSAPAEQLVLRSVSDSIFEAQDGRRYRVTPLPEETGQETRHDSR